MENLLNLLFPPKCVFCSYAGEFICKKCLANCTPITTPTCLVCDRPSELGITHSNCLTGATPTQLLTFYDYSNKIREIIRLAKYKNKQFYALKILSQFTFLKHPNLLAQNGLKDYVIVPIPISKHKLAQRGFNQAELIGRVLGKKFGLNVNTRILVRSKETQSQFKLDRKSRFENLKDAFAVHLGSNSGLKVLVVDDITTTGATFLSASRALLEAGAGEVKCLALSKKVLSQK